MNIELSPYHKNLYNEWKIHRNKSCYNIVFDHLLSNDLDLLRLQNRLERFISEHILFNSHIKKINNELYWIQNSSIKQLEQFHIAYSDQDILDYVAEPFDLESSPLYRFAVFTKDDDCYRFICVLHNILIDNSTFNSFITNISKYYNDTTYKNEVSLVKQAKILNSTAKDLSNNAKSMSDPHKQFWTDARLEFEPLDLRFIRNSNHNKKQQKILIKELRFNFADTVISKITQLYEIHGIDMYWFSQMIFAILMYKYTSQNKFAISCKIKSSKSLEDGFATSIHLLPFNIDADTTVKDIFVQRIEFADNLEGEDINHVYYPVDNVVTSTLHGYLDVIFIETDFRDSEFSFESVSTLKVNHEFEIDLSARLAFEMELHDNKINFRIRYHEGEIDEAILVDFVQHYQKLFTDILHDISNLEMDKAISQYSILDAKEYQKIVFDWNKTDHEYPEDKTIHGLFEEQVLKTPNNVAVVFEDNKLTYQELNEKSNQLAHYLRNEFQIVGDDLIALFLDRSEYIIITILAVLKAGGAYVPIDPSYPNARIKYMLEDTQAKVVLTNEIYSERLKNIFAIESIISTQTETHQQQATSISQITPVIPTTSANPTKVGIHLAQKLCIINIDTIESHNKFKQYPSTNLAPNITSKNLAYVIYTSGTTGVPKGVMIEHNGVLNRVWWMGKECSIAKNDSILQKTPYTFDVSVWELFVSVWCGAKIVFTKSEKYKDSNYLLKLINNENISVIHFVPSMLNAFIDFCIYQLSQSYDVVNKLSSLKHVFCSGEALNTSVVEQLQNLLPQVKIYNLYGPTETSIDVLSYNCTNIVGYTCIGKPIFNTTAYVFNSQSNPLPLGAVGELYIGGTGVARGYLNQPTLTAKMFIANPFQSEEEKIHGKNGRLYKTGDLVRYLADGNIEYIGRNDFQVKIRGYRVELGEIENAILSYPGITQVVVVTKEYKSRLERIDEIENKLPIATDNENKYLVGYYVANSIINKEALLEYLSETLPQYMLPSALIQLDKLPLTLNGKLDRNSLPTPDFVLIDKYVAPRNDLESSICKIYAEILGLSADRLSVVSSFFKLGGNSILAIKLINRLNSQFHSAVKVSNLFTSSTVEKVTNLVQSTINEFEFKDHLINSVNRINLYQPFDLSNTQQAYYFGRLSEFELGNISTHYYSETKFANLDYLKLEIALNKLIQRHIGLRTIFVNGQQQYLEHVPEYKIRYHEALDKKSLLEIRNELSHKIYAIDKFPLFDFIVTKYNDYYILHSSFDILLMDANSCQILFKELGVLYNNTNVQLAELNISYKDYIAKLTQIRQSKLFTKNQEYWQNRQDDYNFNMNLPLRCKPSTVVTPVFNRISKVIAKDVWQRIEDKSRLHGVGVTSLLLTLYAKVLSHWTNQSSLCVNLTLFNRLPLHADINNVIGDFTVLELFKYQDKSDKNIIDTLQHIHQELWNDIEHNLFDGIDFQRLIRKKRGLSNNHILCPVVLTSILGDKIGYGESLVDDSYLGMEYSITQTSQVWLDNKAYETSDGFVAEWDYVEQLFERSTIDAMHKHYCDLLEYTASANWVNEQFPPLRLPDTDLKLIEAANSATQAIVTETLFSYYENYVTTNALLANTAVIEYTQSVHQYNYADVINDSELLAKYLYSIDQRLSLDDSIHPNGRLIAVLSEKGYNQVIATLAIMKSGYAYLPLNIYWPIGRLDEVLTQGQVDTILISRFEANRVEIQDVLKNKYQLIIIEDILDEIHNKALHNITLPCVNPESMAYVIFTSGSTGVPKGVAISHKSALNTIIAINTKYKLSAKDRVLAISDLSFDLSVYDIFGLLAVGGTVVFPRQDLVKEIPHWLELIHAHGISIWNSVPQLANLLLSSHADSYDYLQSLRLFLLSGDSIPLELPEGIKNVVNNAIIVSLGGATECSIWSIWYEIDKTNTNWRSIPYGTAMPNQKIYVLNHNLEHSQINIVGDIYIGGDGLALGYWNVIDKTHASFFVHPDLGRLYKTGDLGRWLHDGYIEFIGRNDAQVKINGYRIELGEISAKLNKLPGIDKAITTILHGEKQNYIVAYLVPKQCDLFYDTTNKYKHLFDRKPFQPTNLVTDSKYVTSTKLDINLDQNKYILRKSYREYPSSVAVNHEVVNNKIARAKIDASNYLRGLEVFARFNKCLSLDKLNIILSEISCIKLPDMSLPKYLYPSAGSSYSVRCYVRVNGMLSNKFFLMSGYYYYNPFDTSLNEAKLWGSMADEDITRIDFIVHWPLIKPMYNKESRRFAYIEVGHMLSLMQRQARILGIESKIEICEQDLDSDNCLLAKLILTKLIVANEPFDPYDFEWVDSIPAIKPNINIETFIKSAEHIYQSTTCDINLENLSVFMQADPYGGRVLENATGLITLSGDESPANLVYSGIYCQTLADNLEENNHGSCMLGYKFHHNTLYAMAIGLIDEEPTKITSNKAQNITLKKCIEKYIIHQLPEYMLPYDYIVLQRLPLSANGKIAMGQLPELVIPATDEIHHHPENEVEAKVCEFYADILGLEVNKIQRYDNFFKLGGDSLLAMKLISKINQKLKINLKTADIFIATTVNTLAAKIKNLGESETKLKEIKL